jgi:hypothetical protein
MLPTHRAERLRDGWGTEYLCGKWHEAPRSMPAPKAQLAAPQVLLIGQGFYAGEFLAF